MREPMPAKNSMTATARRRLALLGIDLAESLTIVASFDAVLLQEAWGHSTMPRLALAGDCRTKTLGN